MRKTQVEIVCCSVDDCVAAHHGGADRIELWAAIPLGGLTPPLGMYVEAKSRVGLPYMVMVRPRPAGFNYTEAEFANMERDVEIFREHDAEGAVFGVLTDNGSLDLARNRRLVERCGKMQKVCHRCFEVVPDPFEALEQLIDLGFTRLLTSGQQASVVEGEDLVRRLIEKANGRIEIMPGAGFRLGNMRGFVERTGCSQVHLTAYGEPTSDSSTAHRADIRYGAAELPDDTSYNVTSVAVVEAAVREVNGS
ncbi:MAG TPA: copper homeostasis protein CutC [Fimbriimonas sp.]